MHEPYIRIVPDAAGAVAMIHGILGTPRHFDRFLPCLPENWSVYNILLDGHGGTPKDFSRSSMAKWKSQITGLLDEISKTHERIVIVGHSMGSLLGIYAADQYPQISNLILLNAPLRIRLRPTIVLQLLKLCFGKTNLNDPFETALQQAAGVKITAKIWQYFGFFPRFFELFRLSSHARKAVLGLKTPVFSLFSAKDELVSPRSAAYFPEKCAILPHSGHYFYAAEDVQFIEATLKGVFL